MKNPLLVINFWSARAILTFGSFFARMTAFDRQPRGHMLLLNIQVGSLPLASFDGFSIVADIPLGCNEDYFDHGPFAETIGANGRSWLVAGSC